MSDLSSTETPARSPDRPWLPYVAPMAAFLVLTAAEGWLPRAGSRSYSIWWYPLAYVVKVALVAAVAWASRATWRDLKPWPGIGTLGIATAIGLAVAAAWVGLDRYYPHPEFLGTRTGFDPHVLPIDGRVAFIIARMFGLVLLVPLIEELFWRSFLIRWVIDPNFTKVPIGRVTPVAALVTSALFALAHPEWLPAMLTGLAWAGLLRYSKSVAACFVSHAVANLGLGLYVLATGAWRFW